MEGILRRRWRRLTVVACAVLLSAFAIAACGGDDDDGGTAASGGASNGASSTDGGTAAETPAKTPAASEKATGTPIKTMTIAAVNWNGPAYPNILETAKLYAKYVNDRGGIAGHKLEVITCDEQGDPNQLATCGRRAVSEKVVAIPGSFTLTGDRIIPILENANISWFGICCPVYPSEQNSPVTFSFGAGQAAYAAYAAKGKELGCKTPSLVLSTGPTNTLYKTVIEKALKNEGLSLKNFVTIPVAAQDYSPQVAQATNGSDCIFGIFSENQWASWLPAFKQSGSEAKLIGPQGNLDEKVAKDFPDVVEGAIVIGEYPNITDPAFDDYREAIEQYKPDPSLDYNSLGGLGTWTAYEAFKQVAETIEGDITNESFLDAANAMTALDTGGKTDKMDLTKPWGDEAPEGNERVFTTSVTYLKFGDDGKLTTETPGFQDMREKFLAAVK
jgi:ABC-type branched-subunit amino acid transport system substrate-binding protein